jgi:hypothetical protein
MLRRSGAVRGAFATCRLLAGAPDADLAVAVEPAWGGILPRRGGC